MLSLLVHAADAVLPSAMRILGCETLHVDTAAGPMHVLEAKGTGTLPPILLLHGLGSCAADWSVLLPRLLPLTRRVVLPDLPGHGRSPAPKGGMDGARVRDATVSLLRGALREPAIVVGNSLGGVAAIRFAQVHPDLVAGLLLVSPGGAPMAEAELDALLAQFQLPSRADALRFMDRVLAEPGWMRPILAAGVRVRMGRPAVRELVSRMSVGDLLTPEEVSALPMPLLCLWGTEDEVLPPESRAFFRTYLPPHARFEEPRGYGHSPYLDDPEDFVRRVASFAREVSPAA